MRHDSTSWIEADLVQLHEAKIHESDDLEFKRCDALRVREKITRDNIVAEVSKDVSAMANAEGGTIVYGIKANGLVAEALDTGFGPDDPSIEWLENIILSNVRPKPDGLHLHSVDLSGPPSGRSAYVVVVQSCRRGCQANDGRYYRRRNFRNDQLGDWEIRELMNRAVQPRIEVIPTVQTLHGSGPVHRYALLLQIRNEGPIRVRDWKCTVTFPCDFLAYQQVTLEKLLVKMKGGSDYYAYRYEAMNASASPLFPDEVVLGAKIDWTVDMDLYARAENQDRKSVV